MMQNIYKQAKIKNYKAFTSKQKKNIAKQISKDKMVKSTRV
jgi:hypothetical protein